MPSRGPDGPTVGPSGRLSTQRVRTLTHAPATAQTTQPNDPADPRGDDDQHVKVPTTNLFVVGTLTCCEE